MYDIHFPAQALQPYIECYWFLRATLTPPAQLEEIVFPDARADLLFSFGSPYLRYHAGQPDAVQPMPTSNLDAQRRYPVHIVQQGQIDLIGVRFRPGGLAGLLPMPLHELAGLTLEPGDVLGPSGCDLEGQLFDAAAQREVQLTLLNCYFLARIEAGVDYSRVMHMATLIEQQQGQETITDLSRHYGYSVRTINRLFQQIIGLSPKFYARTVRFRQVLYALLHESNPVWANIALQAGYYDQPHFVKDFVAFTGITPEAYRAQQQAKQAAPPNHIQLLEEKEAGTGTGSSSATALFWRM